ncbi:MAG: hypothetical protein ACLFUU_11545 [Desulfobacteraceae bacterium]
MIRYHKPIYYKSELTNERLQSTIPHLEEAYERLVWYSTMVELKKVDPEIFDQLWESPFKPFLSAPASPDEEITMMLADMVVYLISGEKIIKDRIIREALPEIDEAYKAILEDGGWMVSQV